MNFKTHILSIFILFFLIGGVKGQAISELIKFDQDGKLVYIPFANKGENNAVNTIPDFSYAGYKFGGHSLPVVPVVIAISPVEGDNLQQIQDAIDAVSAMPADLNGIRGAILLQAGKYNVSAPFSIKASGVVLRGQGQMPADQGGTELYSMSATQHDFITFKNIGGSVSSDGLLLDTIIIPKSILKDIDDGDYWVTCDVAPAVESELYGDKTISLQITANNGDFIGYDSKENTRMNKPFLLIGLYLNDKSKDTVITVYPTDDAYVQGGISASLNFGADGTLAVKNAGVNANTTREIFMKFVLPALDAQVISAELHIFCSNAGDTEINQLDFVSAITNDDWSESTVTYANRPSVISSQRITTPYVAVGANKFSVTDAGGFNVGDKILVTRTPNQAWITAIKMDLLSAIDPAALNWSPDEYKIGYERTITAVNSNEITIDIPLVQTITDNYGGGEISLNNSGLRLNNSGIENMFISSYYAAEDDELHGWTAIVFSGTQDCWARNVTARHFGYACVEIVNGFTTTVQECALLDPKSITTGGRKYPFNIEKGSFNLFQRCYARGGRHSFATGSRVAGPNAFVDCLAEQNFADIGPHHRYATGTLFDYIKGGETRVWDRGVMGSGHGWSGAQTMFWNLETPGNVTKVDSPPGAMNWGIGCSGQTKEGAGYWEKWGTHLLPRSLYLKQLEDRLGPEAVLNTTTLAQRNGRIWDALSVWKGIGSLEDSLPSKNSLLADLRSNDTTLTAFNPATLSYTIKFQAGVSVLPAITWMSYDTAATVQVIPAVEIPDTTQLSVTAGDGTSVSVYNIIMAFMSTNANLTGIKLDGTLIDGFLPAQTDYTIELPYGSTIIPVVTFTKEDALSTVVKTDAAGLPGLTVLLVKAEDGLTSLEYRIQFKLAEPSHVSTLSDLKVDGISVSGFNQETFEYNIHISPAIVDIPEINFTLSDPNSSAVVTNATTLPGTSTIEVTAQDETSVKTYTIHFLLTTGLDPTFVQRVKMYPNPASASFSIELPGILKNLPEIMICNAAGQILVRKQLENLNSEISVEFMNDGIYQVILISDKEVAWRGSLQKIESQTTK